LLARHKQWIVAPDFAVAPRPEQTSNSSGVISKKLSRLNAGGVMDDLLLPDGPITATWG
jgi:hypothetical protein